MGEKLLAQRVLQMLRNTYGQGSKVAAATLEWAAEQADWLWPERSFVPVETPAAEPGGGTAMLALSGGTLSWDGLAELIPVIDREELEPALFASVDAVADLLELEPFERELLSVATALVRLPNLAGLKTRLLALGIDMVTVAGMLAGAAPAAAAGRVRRSAPLSLGLLFLVSETGAGGLDLGVHWRFGRLLDECHTEESAIIEMLAGPRQPAELAREDFPAQAPALDLLVRLLRGALDRRASGVNLLIYGPPGTGKTEFARTLAAEAGAALLAVGECDEDGDEPSRYERLHALKRAQRLLARRSDRILLFDEMEDLFAEAQFAASGARRAGSKIFVNRLLENNPVPTIWTSNCLDIDPAHLRRLTFVLKMDHPGPAARARIVARIAGSEAVAEAVHGLAPFVARDHEAAAVARVTLRAAALSGGGASDAAAIADSLLLGLRGGRPLPPAPDGAGVALDLYGPDLQPLVERLAAPGAARDFSLLLTGPPGTGKTVLAAHLAERLERPLVVKRASDLLSSWLGGTEANIAEAFANAREQGSVLLFDEVDSLLLDRADAQRSWEVTQVNELLTWMDSHPYPFIAATNFPRRLDPAALRRFVFKIELRPLCAKGAAIAYRRFFGCEAPTRLDALRGLTPGDFAVVKRQLRYRPGAGPCEILAMLETELGAKPERSSRIGF